MSSLQRRVTCLGCIYSYIPPEIDSNTVEHSPPTPFNLNAESTPVIMSDPFAATVSYLVLISQATTSN